MNDYSLGVGMFVIRADKVLLTYRIKGAQTGVWEVPAGHVKPEESAERAAARELLEETGLTATALEAFGEYKNDEFRYKCQMFLVTADGNSENLDPRNHSKLEWFEMDALPHPLGATTVTGLEVLRQRHAR